jgi:LacI family transcriptional regulator
MSAPPPKSPAPPMRGATLQQVADAAGVHRSTASRALNPATAKLLSPEVAANIVEIAAQLGYRRDLLAASMRTNRTRLVGILVPDLANPVFAPILAGAEALLAEHGYSVLVANVPTGTEDAAIDLVSGFMSRRAEGLILATAHENDPVLDYCLAHGVPTVLVNRADFAERLSSATPDDRNGMRLAVRHLIALGHRRIAHLAGPQNVSTGRLRLLGFQEELRSAGLPPGPVVTADAYTCPAGQAAARRLFEMTRGVTAIAAANDLLALGAYQELAACGLACPAQISVTGHNDIALVDMVQPPLTTVRIPHDQIGREGACLLLERITHPASPLVQIQTAPELIVRGSTAPCWITSQE